MNKELLEILVNKGLDTGADFSEIFYEESKKIDIILSSSIISKCNIEFNKGVGIRLAKNTEVYYASTNNLEEKNLISVIERLNQNFDGKRILEKINLKEKEEKKTTYQKEHSLKNLKIIKDKLYEYDKFTRDLDKRIDQVNISVIADDQKVTVASSKGFVASDNRILTRFYFKINVKENDHSEYSYFSLGGAKGLEVIDDTIIYKEIEQRVKIALDKLDAKPCPGGEMPVIIESGFGGVLIHEACGHAMEATTVADGTSVLSDKLNQKIATDVVTVIDDGTIPNAWGSLNYDDEGNETQKNILIENGILKKFLIDEISTRKMAGEISGSGRRQDFTFAPTSRMNNTYLAPGSSTVSEMIQSIDYGLYAKTLGGGIVSPSTGDFNFAVLDAYMIRNGKIAEPVKGASLVGSTLDILKGISMVGNNLEEGIGNCGSISGSVPVTASQPTIKIDKILVGGVKVDK